MNGRTRRSLRPALRATFAAVFALLVAATPPLAHAIAGNGKLQIHHIDVGQGDGMLLVSPNGQTALFDNGNYLSCTGIKNYLQGLGVTTVDYHFLSHYHSDHLGCIDDLAAIGITIGIAGYDRGYSYSSGTYTTYVNTLGTKRTTLAQNQTITLDAGSANPVTITCVALNGAGVYSPTGSDENAKSAVYRVSYGGFDEVIGGDLTGDGATDVETTIGPMVGDVEVYKTHHHGSRYSTNDNWLNAITPEVAVIQCGNGNSYGHPTLEALTRLHNHNVKTYWTQTGAGATPNAAWDKVGGTIKVEANLATGQFTVTGSGFTDTYPISGGGPVYLYDTRVPSSVTMLQGTVSQGSYASLGVLDGTRLIVSSALSGGSYRTDWYATATLAHPPTQLTVNYHGSFNTTRTQTLYLYNWSTAAWVQIDQASIGTATTLRSWSTNTPGVYVNTSGQIRLRVQGNTRTSSYTSRGDYLEFVYQYQQGTLVTQTPEEYVVMKAEADREAFAKATPQANVTKLEAGAFADGVRLQWTVGRNVHVDGFNVYRELPDGSHEHVGQEAMLEATSDDVTFGFVDRTPPASGTYWLGARSCSGPEALLGPIHVNAFEGAPAVAALAFAVSPNPVRGTRVTFAATLPVAGDARLDVFDLSGRRLATPFAGRTDAGELSVEWTPQHEDGTPLAAGMYFARFEAAGQSRLARITVLAR